MAAAPHTSPCGVKVNPTTCRARNGALRYPIAAGGMTYPVDLKKILCVMNVSENKTLFINLRSSTHELNTPQERPEIHFFLFPPLSL